MKAPNMHLNMFVHYCAVTGIVFTVARVTLGSEKVSDSAFRAKVRDDFGVTRVSLALFRGNCTFFFPS